MKLDLDGLDWRRLLPRVTLYVHLSEEHLTRDANGVARIEGLGPITVEQVRELLRDSRQAVTVKPVVDLADQRPADAYEKSLSMARALHLRTPADVFPFSTNLSRSKDADHVRPYRPPNSGGPPGQTHLNNLAPMSRFHHRLKTHGRWQLRQPQPNVYLWRSPHGRCFLVDALGTHRLPEHAGEVTWRAATARVPADLTGTDLPHPETSVMEAAFERYLHAAA